MRAPVILFWFRRDLRLEDNAGLSHALAAGVPVLPIYIFDPVLLAKETHRRVDYVHQVLSGLNAALQDLGSSLHVFHSEPTVVFRELAMQYEVRAIFCNQEYEPALVERDQAVAALGFPFKAFRDHVIFDDIRKSDGTPYTVFTPYAARWRALLDEAAYRAYPLQRANFHKTTARRWVTLEEMGFCKTDIHYDVTEPDPEMLRNYATKRNYPALKGTSRLGTALRFGTLSIRRCVSLALAHSEAWLSELIWREFFTQILRCFPHNRSFKPRYEFIRWRNDEAEFERWRRGETGYPLVDAGMRELRETGYMHNRVRMVTASFLCKHLLIDWRWGEAHFAQHLNDYDLAANNGNWQWASGSGCDAAPYFRIFNPDLQAQKFDMDFTYIQRWVPEWGTPGYPSPVVSHRSARERALETYRAALEI